MNGGYSETCLWVDLSRRTTHREEIGPLIVREHIGGYGLGARLLYDRIPAGVDPMSPENILGFAIGPLTGSPTPTGTRWTVMGKSPLTGTWGDANGSGYFGAAMRRAGIEVSAKASPRPRCTTRCMREKVCDAERLLRIGWGNSRRARWLQRLRGSKEEQ